MPLTKPNQELKRDLQGIASDLKWSAVELKRIAERLTLAGNEPDAQAIYRMVAIFQGDEARLTARLIEITAVLELSE
ncbi:hypothetical protein ACOI7N_13680 [Pseudomonas sp. P2758]|uniref:hypothetical protein n=1 Tax=Pseudomonas sp. P2758 TaxID=3409916 RepID=UPI003B592B1F